MAGARLHAPEAAVNTFRDLKRHGTTSIGVAALLCIPYLLAQFFWLIRPGIFAGLAMAISAFVTWVWLPWLLTIATRDYAQGKDPGVGELLATTRFGRLFSYLFAQISMNLVCFAAALLGALPLAGVAIAIVAQGDVNIFEIDSFGPLILIAFAAAIVGLLIGFAAYLVVYLRIGFAPVANVLEETGPFSSIGRSNRLSRGHRLDFLLLLVMVIGVTFVISMVVQLPATLAAVGTTGGAGFSFEGGEFSGGFGPFGSQPELPAPRALVVALSGYVVNLLTSVLSIGVLTNFYLALRGEELVRDAEVPAPVS